MLTDPNEPGVVWTLAYQCNRCGHKWLPRKDEHPRVCPQCHSAYWDKPKRPEGGQ